mgnify:CR=1 FL=1
MKRNLLLLSIVSTLGCGIDITLDDVGRTPCEAMCDAQASAGCAGFSTARCESACGAFYTQAPRCEAALDAAMLCAARSTYACTDGRPTAASCRAEVQAAGRCIDAQPR